MIELLSVSFPPSIIKPLLWNGGSQFFYILNPLRSLRLCVSKVLKQDNTTYQSHEFTRMAPNICKATVFLRVSLWLLSKMFVWVLCEFVADGFSFSLQRSILRKPYRFPLRYYISLVKCAVCSSLELKRA